MRIVLTLLFAVALIPSCDSEDKPPVDADTSGEAAVCAGTIADHEACMNNDECMSCICQSFGHSKICSKTCTGDPDCPAPFGGCTGGFCRP